MNTLAAIIAAIISLAAFYGVGVYHGRTSLQGQIAAAKAEYQQRVSEANQAEASLKQQYEGELAELRKLVEATPPNPTIAIKQDAAKRIGAIR